MTPALLAALMARANSRGLVLASEDALLQELRCERHALRQAIADAASVGQIEVLAPLPFLVARLPGSWPGRRPKHARTAAKTGAAELRGDSFQSSLSQSKLYVKESYRHSSESALLQEILETLRESDPALFRGALKAYTPGEIRTVLHRVRRNPGIRTNRTALFRYLLPRLRSEREKSH